MKNKKTDKKATLEKREENIFDLVTIPYEGKLCYPDVPAKLPAEFNIFFLYIGWVIDEYSGNNLHLWTFTNEGAARNWCVHKPNFAIQAGYLPEGTVWWYILVKTGVNHSGGHRIPFAYYSDGKEVEKEELPKQLRHLFPLFQL